MFQRRPEKMTRPKRKQEDEAPEGANKRQALSEGQHNQPSLENTPAVQPADIPSNDTQQMETQPFRLVDLPAELRDNIYAKALEIHTPVRLSRLDKKQPLKSDCRLLLVSKQVHDEFKSVMALNAPVIETIVPNFHFGHVITFLNRLPEAQLSKMAKDSNENTRVLKIRLYFEDCISRAALKDSNCKQLQRWLNRMDSTKKKGTNVDFQYVLDETTSGSSRLYFNKYLGPKGVVELDKIIEAGRGHFLDWSEQS